MKMKSDIFRIQLILLTVFMATTAMGVSSEDPESPANIVPRYHAIVIGINDYDARNGKGWTPLKTAEEDALAVADMLENTYGFDVKKLFGRQATRSAIIELLDELSSYNIDDAVVIYYAGHGYYDNKLAEGFWIPADARKTSGKHNARQDWIWNSTLTKIIGASEARHVLVIADSCYSGSLFRGELLNDIETDLTWYMRAISKPSRYLITSGDLEPVLDSGATHSIFAQSLLNSLKYPDKSVFSASELGAELRLRVGTLTGQMVRSEPLRVASHAGGEFIFVGKEADFPGPNPPVQTATVYRGEEPSDSEPGHPSKEKIRQTVLRDVALLNDQEASNSAFKLLDTYKNEVGEDALTQILSDYMNRDKQQKRRDELQHLIARLESRKQEEKDPVQKNTGYARPRILACLGPENIAGGTDDAAEAILCRIALRAALEKAGGIILVEREALEDILQEMDLGSSDLSDPRAQTEIGKLLPASLLLLGDIIPQAENRAVFLRLVDTETTRVLGSFSATLNESKDIMLQCEELVEEIKLKAVRVKPLSAQILSIDGLDLQAAVGRFHGAEKEMLFDVIRKKEADEALQKEKIGVASVSELGTMKSILTLQSQRDISHEDISTLWVAEVTEISP